MVKGKCFVLLTVLLFVSFSVTSSKTTLADDKELGAEDVISGHLNSIGSPEVLAGIKNRGIGGIVEL